MSEVKRPRRYYLGERSNAIENGDQTLASVWRWKQEAMPGAPLPDDFPFLSELAAAGYTTIEDLDGADERELLRRVKLPMRDAQFVLAKLAALIGPEESEDDE